MNEIDFKAAIQHMRPSTQAIYTNLWGRWRNWCKEHDVAPFPITQETFDTFISDMRSRRRSEQYVRHFLSVLRLVNKLVGYDGDLSLGTNEFRYMPPYILLNSAMMPAPGTYRLRELTRDEWVETIRIAAQEESIQSYVGYPDTAKHVQEITGLPIEVNRAEVTLDKSATLFIVKLKYRVTDPAQKGQFAPSDADYVYYVAQYVA
jgi:hypothetical protein